VNISKSSKSPGARIWLLAPACTWLTLFVLLPLVILWVYSFGGRDELGRVVLGFSFDNYVRFINGPYWSALTRSLVLSTLTTGSTLVLGYIFAIWITILRPTGILSHLAAACGLGQNLPPLLYTPYAVWLGMVYNYLPYMILPLYTSVEKVDIKLIEASLDLGATPLRTLFKVLLPLTSGGIIAGSLMVFIPSLGDYVTPDLLGGAKYMYMGNLIQNQFLTVRDWAFGSAVSTVLIVIVSAAVWVYMKYADTSDAV